MKISPNGDILILILGRDLPKNSHDVVALNTYHISKNHDELKLQSAVR